MPSVELLTPSMIISKTELFSLYFGVYCSVLNESRIQVYAIYELRAVDCIWIYYFASFCFIFLSYTR